MNSINTVAVKANNTAIVKKTSKTSVILEKLNSYGIKLALDSVVKYK